MVQLREASIEAGNNYTLSAIPSERWAFENMGGDLFMLVMHFVVGILLVILIELNLFKFLKEFTFRQMPAPREELWLDDDVADE